MTPAWSSRDGEDGAGKKNQVATPVPHTAVNAAGCRRLSSTPSPSRLLVAAPGPAPCRCNAPFSGTGSCLFGYVVRPSLCPVHVARRQSRRPMVQYTPLVGEDAPLDRCCDGAGDAASCTRSRRAGVAHSSSARSARRRVGWLLVVYFLSFFLTHSHKKRES